MKVCKTDNNHIIFWGSREERKISGREAGSSSFLSPTPTPPSHWPWGERRIKRKAFVRDQKTLDSY